MNNMYYPNAPLSGMQNWYNPTVTQPQQDSYGNTNVYKVTSLDEAIMKSNVRPSETVYFNQSKNEFYNVRVDVNGNKTWQTFVYNIPNSTENMPVTRGDFDTLVAKVTAIENKIATEKELTEDAKSNG